MNINQHNYEAFFLDYHEGNLSSAEVAELLFFIEQHPQLKNDFENFKNFSLDKSSETFSGNKELLKRNRTITLSNYEEFFILHVEKQLNELEIQQLSLFTKQHPHLQKELNFYKATVIQADLSQIFSDKESLKREKEADLAFFRESGGYEELALLQKIILVPDLSIKYQNKEALKRHPKKSFLFYYAAAAAVLILCFTVFLRNSESPKTSIALVDSVDFKTSAKNPVIFATPEQAQKIHSSPVVEKAPKQIKNKSNIAIVKPDSEEPVKLLSKPIEESELLAANPKIEKSEELRTDNPPIEIIENLKAEKIYPQVELKSKRHFSLLQLASGKIKEKILDQEVVAMQRKTGELNKMTGWDVLQLAANSIGKLTGKDVNVKPNYNEEGEVTSYAFNAGKLGFSANR